MTGKIKHILSVLLFSSVFHQLHGQNILTLHEAFELGVKNYGTIKSKSFHVHSSEHALLQAKREYTPNVVLSAQQVYGTINGQNGPLYGFGGVASSGVPLPEQSWNAAFGALYLANVNWEVFSFGRSKWRIEVANNALDVAENDLILEQFQHLVRIAAAYLNTLATQRLSATQQKNLERAQIIQRSVSARAKSGLIAGVDSALANAEVANAKIALLRARDLQLEEEQKLQLLIGLSGKDFQLDSTFILESPVIDGTGNEITVTHPVLNFYQSRVIRTRAQLRLSQRSHFPSLNLVGIFQARASGFSAQYGQDQAAFTHNYSDGISPTRTNYLIGVNLVWNLTAILRANAEVKSLNYLTLATQADLDLAEEQMNTNLNIANAKLTNALQIQRETPIQVQSASDAYVQKNALYENGLTTLVDVTQTLYALNRAESDRDLAFINVWQALLLKAASTGDLSLFTNQFNR